jgi:DNA polymerase I-like protein with 3'-5' exonuclease and polymerase domains
MSGTEKSARNAALTEFVAVDFETYYDKEYSLRNMSTWAYVYDDKFDPYLIALYQSPGLEWVGDPRKADWSVCHDRWLLAHNAGFDAMVFKRCQELGIIPKSIIPKGWICTADLAAYLRCKRDLATCSRILLERPRSKVTRANMLGKNYQDAVAAGMEDELLEYGAQDAIDCWDLWAKFRGQWPDHEQETSRIMREGCFYGMQIDVSSLDEGVKLLGHKLDEALAKMPWADTHEDKPLSHKKIREQGREDGIPVPASLAVTSEDATKWAAKYGDEYPWTRAVSEYRSINALYKKLRNLKKGTDAQGVYRFAIKYFGAATGRASGGSGHAAGAKVNMLNMPRGEMFGVNFRNYFIARPGHVLMAPDLAQIEARFLLWAVHDDELLALVRREGNIYSAYAKNQGWYSGEDLKADDYDMYQRTKATVLSLGYGSGWVKFQSMAATAYKVHFTDAEAQKVVNAYRAANPKVTAFWAEQHKWLRLSARHGDETHEVVLPSGRDLVYYNPHFVGRDVKAAPVRGQYDRKYYGAMIVENFCQAGTRDILCDARRAIEAASPDNRILYDVYDELVIEIPLDHAEERAEEIAHLMTNSSPWAAGCPIECEYELIDKYTK